jgi:hypothetical protein
MGAAPGWRSDAMSAALARWAASTVGIPALRVS